MGQSAASAFAMGIDARVQGEPTSANPFGVQTYDGRQWLLGWRECQSRYASWRPEHWGPAAPLPPIRNPGP